MRKVLFRLHGARITTIVNRAGKRGIALSHIRATADGFTCLLFPRDVVAFENLLQELEIEYTAAKRRRILERLRTRPFLAAASAAVVLLVAFFGNNVYGVEISGNSYVSTAAIRRVLEEEHVDGFASKGSLDTDAIARRIGALEGVSFASVRIRGSKLSVSVKESLPETQPEAVSYESVTATRGGVVTKVVAESGTPLVRVGDIVAAGDVLIDAAYAFTEGGAPSAARGEVWASTVYRKELVLPAFSVGSDLTGAVYVSRELTIFGRRIGKESADPYALCDVEERVILDYGGFCRVTEKVYRERRENVAYNDFDLLSPELIERARIELLAEIPFHAYLAGGVLAEEKKLDNVLYIVVYCTVVQRIDSLFMPDAS